MVAYKIKQQRCKMLMKPNVQIQYHRFLSNLVTQWKRRVLYVSHTIWQNQLKYFNCLD